MESKSTSSWGTVGWRLIDWRWKASSEWEAKPSGRTGCDWKHPLKGEPLLFSLCVCACTASPCAVALSIDCKKNTKRPPFANYQALVDCDDDYVSGATCIKRRIISIKLKSFFSFYLFVRMEWKPPARAYASSFRLLLAHFQLVIFPFFSLCDICSSRDRQWPMRNRYFM